jgi:uncharacterized OB-fold protein
VDLEEGPRAVAQIVGCPVETPYAGMPVEAVFESFPPADGGDPAPILRFRPVAAD